MKQLLKLFILWIIGGMIYYMIEIGWRGYSHWTMFIVGGLCFNNVGAINEYIPWGMPIWKQSLIGATIITTIEFIAGCIVNLLLEWDVWDYSNMPFNILGQICVPFFFAWILLSIVCILLDDWLRYWLFKEDKPKYKLK